MSLSERAYHEIRRMIVRLELAPGAVIRDDELQRVLGLGRTPIREALQRLVRDQFVTVIPRRGMFVSGVDVSELALLYETRARLEPYAMRLACARGTAAHWDEMARVLETARPDSSPDELLQVELPLVGGPVGFRNLFHISPPMAGIGWTPEQGFLWFRFPS